jgi:hypothetical protein
MFAAAMEGEGFAAGANAQPHTNNHYLKGV